MELHLTKIKRPDKGFDLVHPETGYVLSPFVTQGKKYYAVYFNGKAVFFDTFNTALYFLKRWIKSKYKSLDKKLKKDTL